MICDLRVTNYELRKKISGSSIKEIIYLKSNIQRTISINE